MRLINSETLDLEEFLGIPPPYAILSHIWGPSEWNLQQWENASAEQRGKYDKVTATVAEARRSGLPYVWVDTVCIDKASSAELSEAINSMYAWYEDATICYVYLEDVPYCDVEQLWEPSTGFRTSRWFTRGWTLQELLAPQHLTFYSKEWKSIGTRRRLAVLLAEITGIGREYLGGTLPDSRTPTRRASVAQRLSWASNRVTTRREDIAYCLLGLLGVNMSLLYGEGSRAFVRLQEELIKISDDQSLFAWTIIPGLFHKNGAFMGDNSEVQTAALPRIRLGYLKESQWKPPERPSLLAPDPVVFYASAGIIIAPNARSTVASPYSMTNVGLSISLPILETHTPSVVVAALNCTRDGATGPYERLGLVLMRPRLEGNIYARWYHACEMVVVDTELVKWRSENMYFSKPLLSSVGLKPSLTAIYGFWLIFPKGLGDFWIDYGMNRSSGSTCMVCATWQPTFLGVIGFDKLEGDGDYVCTVHFRDTDASLAFWISMGFSVAKDEAVPNTWFAKAFVYKRARDVSMRRRLSNMRASHGDKGWLQRLTRKKGGNRLDSDSRVASSVGSPVQFDIGVSCKEIRMVYIEVESKSTAI
jgi:hypothetical protein